MASEGVDYRIVSAVLAVALLVLSVYHVYAVRGAASAPSPAECNVSSVAGVHAFYLYPKRCVNCNLNQPGQCDFCNSYYDDRVMDVLSDEIGVPIGWYVTDVVFKPNVFVASKNAVGLGDARTKYNIAHVVCDLTASGKACDLYRSEVQRTRSCIVGYGLGNNTLVYHYTGTKCNACALTTPVVKELAGLMYNDTVNYSVKYVDHDDSEQLKLISECFTSFSNIDYVPQVLCPANGKDLTGEFTLSKLRDFADECIRSG